MKCEDILICIFALPIIITYGSLFIPFAYFASTDFRKEINNYLEKKGKLLD
jgi:hypothetical protein